MQIFDRETQSTKYRQKRKNKNKHKNDCENASCNWQATIIKVNLIKKKNINCENIALRLKNIITFVIIKICFLFSFCLLFPHNYEWVRLTCETSHKNKFCRRKAPRDRRQNYNIISLFRRALKSTVWKCPMVSFSKQLWRWCNMLINWLVYVETYRSMDNEFMPYKYWTISKIQIHRSFTLRFSSEILVIIYIHTSFHTSFSTVIMFDKDSLTTLSFPLANPSYTLISTPLLPTPLVPSPLLPTPLLPNPLLPTSLLLLLSSPLLPSLLLSSLLLSFRTHLLPTPLLPTPLLLLLSSLLLFPPLL